MNGIPSGIAQNVRESAQSLRQSIYAADARSARWGVQNDMAEHLMGFGAPPMYTMLEAKDGHLLLQLHGTMTPQEYQHIAKHLSNCLSQHMLFDRLVPHIHCSQNAAGEVCISAEAVGLSAEDLNARIHTYAEHQREYDVFEDHHHSRHPDAHLTHEKMYAAASNLKHMAETEMKTQISQDVRLCRVKGEKPGTYTLTLQLMGVMDRVQAQPAMGALVAAFRRRWRGGLLTNGITHADHDYHTLAENLTPQEFSGLVHELASPVLAVNTGTLEGIVKPPSLVHLGAGQEN